MLLSSAYRLIFLFLILRELFLRKLPVLTREKVRIILEAEKTLQKVFEAFKDFLFNP